MEIAHRSSILGMTTNSKLATGQRSPSISDRGAASPLRINYGANYLCKVYNTFISPNIFRYELLPSRDSVDWTVDNDPRETL